MPSAYTEAESSYLEAYSAAKQDGVITTTERNILQATANALKITSERTKELENIFDSDEAEHVSNDVAEATVVQQWTDENGHTWRRMDDGTSRWWNGSDRFLTYLTIVIIVIKVIGVERGLISLN